jgi:hypothetical protein
VTIMAERRRVTIRGKRWKKPITVDWAKFETVADAMRAVLTHEPVTFTDLVKRVGQRLPDFEGSIAWYAITCARELEARGELVRTEKPVRYSRADRSRARRPPS